jgi:hypothetical protein
MKTFRGTGADGGTGHRRDGKLRFRSTSARRLWSLSARAPFSLGGTAVPNVGGLEPDATLPDESVRDGAAFRQAPGETVLELPVVRAETARPPANAEGPANRYRRCVIVRGSDLTCDVCVGLRIVGRRDGRDLRRRRRISRPGSRWWVSMRLRGTIVVLLRGRRRRRGIRCRIGRCRIGRCRIARSRIGRSRIRRSRIGRSRSAVGLGSVLGRLRLITGLRWICGVGCNDGR